MAIKGGRKNLTADWRNSAGRYFGGPAVDDDQDACLFDSQRKRQAFSVYWTLDLGEM